MSIRLAKTLVPSAAIWGCQVRETGSKCCIMQGQRSTAIHNSYRSTVVFLKSGQKTCREGEVASDIADLAGLFGGMIIWRKEIFWTLKADEQDSV